MKVAWRIDAALRNNGFKLGTTRKIPHGSYASSSMNFNNLLPPIVIGRPLCALYCTAICLPTIRPPKQDVTDA
jgi:hypothetical protein